MAFSNPITKLVFIFCTIACSGCSSPKDSSVRITIRDEDGKGSDKAIFEVSASALHDVELSEIAFGQCVNEQLQQTGQAIIEVVASALSPENAETTDTKKAELSPEMKKYNELLKRGAVTMELWKTNEQGDSRLTERVKLVPLKE